MRNVMCIHLIVQTLLRHVSSNICNLKGVCVPSTKPATVDEIMFIKLGTGMFVTVTVSYSFNTTEQGIYMDNVHFELSIYIRCLNIGRHVRRDKNYQPTHFLYIVNIN